MGSEQLIANELLAFIQHAIDTMDEISILQICKTNFKREEICSSKELLYRTLGKADLMPSRRRDEKGERSLQDIINLLKETDPDDVPAFVAKRLHKLPPVTFDHVDVTRLLKDITTLKATLAEVQLKLEASESAISDLRAELLSLKSTDSVSRSSVASNVNMRRGAQNASVGSIESATTPECAPLAADERNSPRPAADSPARPAAMELTSRGTTSTPSRDYAAAAAAVPSRRSQPQGKKPCEAPRKSVTEGSPKKQCDKEGFIKVERRKKKPASRNHHGNAPVGQEHSLRPEVRSTQLYVSRLHWSTKVEELVDYVRRKSKFTLRVERLASRHKVNFSSFVIRVPTHHLETFMKEDFWPQGVVFRKFRGRLPADSRYTSLTPRVT